jgi:hypothetical protein
MTLDHGLWDLPNVGVGHIKRRAGCEGGGGQCVCVWGGGGGRRDREGVAGRARPCHGQGAPTARGLEGTKLAIPRHRDTSSWMIWGVWRVLRAELSPSPWRGPAAAALVPYRTEGLGRIRGVGAGTCARRLFWSLLSSQFLPRFTLVRQGNIHQWCLRRSCLQACAVGLVWLTRNASRSGRGRSAMRCVCEGSITRASAKGGVRGSPRTGSRTFRPPPIREGSPARSPGGPQPLLASGGTRVSDATTGRRGGGRGPILATPPHLAFDFNLI